jgi:dipeptidase D
MDYNISNLEPKIVWNNFYKLTQIPRPSKKEAAIIAFMQNFGKNLGLETITDEVGNVIIRKPATKGFENKKGIILQGHLDMVPQKNNDTVHNFETDPIKAYSDGTWVKAQGTTLGADNGIGVAATMSVLESNNIEHGLIEALFTTDEETGMTGAFGLKSGILKGDILLNLDSEQDGEIFIGCAGGINANIDLTFSTESVSQNSRSYKIRLTGLKGGHSGIDINMGRGNSNKIITRFLKFAIEKFGIRIATLEGGNLRNAIPREAHAIVVVSEQHQSEFENAAPAYEKMLRAEYDLTEPDLSLKLASVDMPLVVMDSDSQLKLIHALYACPNGVLRMTDAMPDLVQTSNNLSIVKINDNNVHIQCLLRSSVDSSRKDFAEMIKSVFELAGASIKLTGEYPGWKPNIASPILKLSREIYKNMHGKLPDIKAIHAGLECGLLGGAYPNLDMISFGPTIRHPHSPDEKVEIQSVQNFWNFLIEILKNVDDKNQI